MACGGKCTITEYQYGTPTVVTVVADTPDSNCPPIIIVPNPSGGFTITPR